MRRMIDLRICRGHKQSETEPLACYACERLKEHWWVRSRKVERRWSSVVNEAALFFATVTRLYPTGVLNSLSGLEDLSRDSLQMERLRPTYVKADQNFSMIAGLASKGVREELILLQGRV